MAEHLTHGETYGPLKVLGEVKTKNGVKYRVGCGACGFSKQLVRATRFNRGKERCSRCAKGAI